MISNLHIILQKTRAIHLFLLALAVRIIYSIYFWKTFGVEITNDALDYSQFAHFILEQGWMVLDISKLQAHAGPGYPLLMALDISLFNSQLFPLTLAVQILSNAMVPVVVFLLVKKLTKHHVLAVVAGLWLTVYLQHIRYAPMLTKENLVFFLLPLTIYLFIALKEKWKWGLALLLVVEYTYLIHTDERYFFYLPLFLLYLILPFDKKTISQSIGIACGIFILMMPWLYRNYKVYDRPVILTERVSKITDKFLGIKQPLNQFRFDHLNPYDRKNLPVYEKMTDSLVKGLKIRSKQYKYISRMENGIADGHIPRTFTYLEAKKFEVFELLRPVRFKGGYVANGYRYFPAWKLSSNLIYGIQYGIILILAFAGIITCFRKSVSLEWHLLLVLMLMHIFLHSFIGYGLQRYRVPIDFLFIIFAIRFIWFRINKRGNARS
jgi:hypothetical protein